MKKEIRKPQKNANTKIIDLWLMQIVQWKYYGYEWKNNNKGKSVKWGTQQKKYYEGFVTTITCITL